MGFWVVGGEYTDTHFREIVPGRSEERHGPFASYEEAYRKWSARSWATVDDAMTRFRIVEDLMSRRG